MSWLNIPGNHDVTLTLAVLGEWEHRGTLRGFARRIMPKEAQPRPNPNYYDFNPKQRPLTDAEKNGQWLTWGIEWDPPQASDQINAYQVSMPNGICLTVSSQIRFVKFFGPPESETLARDAKVTAITSEGQRIPLRNARISRR